MHKHKKCTYTVKFYGAIGFPVVDKTENPFVEKFGTEKTPSVKILGVMKPFQLFKDVKPWIVVQLVEKVPY